MHKTATELHDKPPNTYVTKYIGTNISIYMQLRSANQEVHDAVLKEFGVPENLMTYGSHWHAGIKLAREEHQLRSDSGNKKPRSSQIDGSQSSQVGNKRTLGDDA
jgi:hypothetical protein